MVAAALHDNLMETGWLLAPLTGDTATGAEKTVVKLLLADQSLMPPDADVASTRQKYVLLFAMPLTACDVDVSPLWLNTKDGAVENDESEDTCR